MASSPKEIEQLGADSVHPEHLAPVYAAAQTTLRAGFLVAAALFVLGLAWSAISGGDIAEEVIPIEKIPGQLSDGEPMSVVVLAFLSLMVTPLVTVLRVAIAFFRLGDRRFAISSFLVLAILALSMTLALVR